VRAVRCLELGDLRGNEMSKKIALYKVGYRAELRASKILKEWGYTVVRSAGSKGPFDLVGWDSSKIILVQVKVCPTGKVAYFGTLRKELANVLVPANAKVELWIWERRKGFHYFSI